MRLNVTIDIAASPERIWGVIEPVENHTEWMADAECITFTSARRRGVDTTFDCLTRVGPFRTNDKMRITEWEPNRVMGIEHAGVVTGRGKFVLNEMNPEITRFSWNEQLIFPWRIGGPITGLLAKPILKRIWLANLSSLRTICES